MTFPVKPTWLNRWRAARSYRFADALVGHAPVLCQKCGSVTRGWRDFSLPGRNLVSHWLCPWCDLICGGFRVAPGRVR